MAAVKVLIVDDEQELASTLAERLNIRGFDASAVYCGEDALPFIRAGDIPDVVLVDLKMPTQGGMETLAAIKKFDPDIEVILFTSYGTGRSKNYDQKGKPYDFIMKPSDINEITEKINKAAAKRLTVGKQGTNPDELVKNIHGKNEAR